MNNLISQQLVEKTMMELAQVDSPKSNLRSWGNPEGYRFLLPWSNAVLLRFFIRMFTVFLPKSEYRRKSQVDDASRSVVRNIEEGYKRATTGEYVRFISFSQGSLEEVKGDVREMTEDKFLKSKPGSSLLGLGINLGEFNQSLRKRNGLGDIKGEAKGGVKGGGKGEVKGNYGNIKEPLKSSNSPLASPNLSSKNPLISPSVPFKDFTYKSITVLYPPLSRVKANDLSYEIFMELINKTDWLLRKLVLSLETKMQVDKKKLY